MTSLQVKQVIYALHPAAVENPTSLKTIKYALDLQSYMDKHGMPVSLRCSSSNLWLMGEQNAREYIQDMIQVIKTIDADMRVQDSK